MDLLEAAASYRMLGGAASSGSKPNVTSNSCFVCRQDELLCPKLALLSCSLLQGRLGSSVLLWLPEARSHRHWCEGPQPLAVGQVLLGLSLPFNVPPWPY